MSAAPIRPPVLDLPAAPWVACRSHEDEHGSRWTIDPDEVAYYRDQPYVSIYAADGTTICNAHDLFEFKDRNVAHVLAAAPLLLGALTALWEDSTTMRPETRELVRRAFAAAGGER